MEITIKFIRLVGFYIIALILLFLILVDSRVFVKAVILQSNQKAQMDIESQPFLIYRFDSPISPDSSWDELRKQFNNLTRDDLSTIAIRICSDQKLLLSLPSAVSEPYGLIEDIKSRFLETDQPTYLFLRSEDCITKQIPNMYAMEVWGMRKDSSLPPYVERYRYEEVKMLSLGFNPSICSTAKINFESALENLIKQMNDDTNSFGVIIGYTFPREKLDPSMKKKLGKATKIMKRSGLPKYRYTISNEIWHAADSECSTEKVTQPSIFFITKR